MNSNNKSSIFFYASKNKKYSNEEFEEWYNNIKRGLNQQLEINLYMENRILFKKNIFLLSNNRKKQIREVLQNFIE